MTERGKEKESEMSEVMGIVEKTENAKADLAKLRTVPRTR